MFILAIPILLIALLAHPALAQQCVDCHKTVTPNIVSDWQLSKHSQNAITCSVCHGDGHSSAQDVAKVKIPTPETCGGCHEERVKEFKKGKHAAAWAAMKAMPTAHWQPMALMEGMKGCGGCHKLGLKTEAEIQELKKQGGGFGVASCDACHTRHTFSVQEARQPQACQTCHMGFDHPQWEMYSGSKHGVRYLLKQTRTLPERAAAPTCQTCHMQEGNHAVRTAWGFLAVRLPMPEDKQWAADRVTILQGLGVLDPDGKATGRLDVVKAADVARLTQEDWQQERDKMLKTCNGCHSANFARGELEKGDEMIKAADRLMADAIRTVAALYKDGLLPKPKNYAYPFPDLLTFHDAPTVIEQKLFVMFLEHRMRTFQGAFHASPDYSLWYGWSEMTRDLTEIKTAAEELRRRAQVGGQAGQEIKKPVGRVRGRRSGQGQSSP
ncbi:MAG TPA: multiheme c-type cytochrome [Candidatus Methylomirabilis sp.]|nr:multiheme c-type cytochrome [Candidatus Methylomirabilis sp.]